MLQKAGVEPHVIINQSRLQSECGAADFLLYVYFAPPAQLDDRFSMSDNSDATSFLVESPYKLYVASEKKLTQFNIYIYIYIYI